MVEEEEEVGAKEEEEVAEEEEAAMTGVWDKEAVTDVWEEEEEAATTDLGLGRERSDGGERQDLKDLFGWRGGKVGGHQKMGG